MSSEYITEIPWNDSTTWVFGDWYPLPYGFMQRNNPEWIMEGYGIFKLQENGFEGDIDPVSKDGLIPLPFSTALHICEARNGRKMIG